MPADCAPILRWADRLNRHCHVVVGFTVCGCVRGMSMPSPRIGTIAFRHRSSPVRCGCRLASLEPATGRGDALEHGASPPVKRSRNGAVNLASPILADAKQLRRKQPSRNDVEYLNEGGHLNRRPNLLALHAVDQDRLRSQQDHSGSPQCQNCKAIAGQTAEHTASPET